MNYSEIIKKSVLGYATVMILLCLSLIIYEHRHFPPINFEIEHLLMLIIPTYLSSRYVVKDTPFDFIFRLFSFDYIIYVYYNIHSILFISFLLNSFVLWILIELFLIMRKKTIPSDFFLNGKDPEKVWFWKRIYIENKLFVIIGLLILIPLGIDNVLNFMGFTNPESTMFRSFILYLILIIYVGCWLFYMVGLTVVLYCAKYCRKFFKSDVTYFISVCSILILVIAVLIYLVNH